MTRPQILKTNTFTLGDISENDDNLKRRQSIDDDELDYRSEVDVGDSTAKDIKVIVGRNRVRIIGERAFGSLEGTNGFHKVVQVPSTVDPLSLKSNLKNGKVVLTGKYANKTTRKWTINNRGLMTVKDDGCARITVDLPKGIDPSQVRVKTMTKHYLVVSNSPHADLSKSPSKPVNDDIAGDFIETFELPSDCDLKSLSKRTMGGIDLGGGIRIAVVTHKQIRIQCWSQTPVVYLLKIMFKYYNFSGNLQVKILLCSYYHVYCT